LRFEAKTKPVKLIKLKEDSADKEKADEIISNEENTEILLQVNPNPSG
jgi:hypothetical protein